MIELRSTSATTFKYISINIKSSSYLHSPLQLSRIIPRIIILILLNMLIIPIVAFEQKKHSNLLDLAFTFDRTDGWVEGIVVD